MTTVLFYNATATTVVRQRMYRSRRQADAAIRRASIRGQVAATAHIRTSEDPPTEHH